MPTTCRTCSGRRRIGPDLSRVGLKYSDEWHLAHFWNPAHALAGFDHGALRGLFEAPGSRSRSSTVSEGTQDVWKERRSPNRLFDFASKEQIKLTPNAEGLLFVPLEARGKSPLIWTPNKEFTGNAVRIAAETEDLQALMAYLQKLGTNRGKWRDRVRAAAARGHGGHAAALGGMDRPRQGGLRASLHRLPRRQWRRQRCRRDLPVQAAAAQLHERPCSSSG